MPGSSKSKPATHPLVEALNPDPARPPQPSVKLFGLPGPAPDADHTRLWLDEGLSSYLDVPNGAILYSKTLPDDAGTVVWVAADAALTHGSVSSHETQASFLTGELAATHLAGAAGAAGATAPGAIPVHPLPTIPSACGPCITHIAPCTHPPACPALTVSPSACGPCITETCPQTYLGPCLSNPAICPPTRVPPCPLQSFPGPCAIPTLPPACPITHAPPCPITQAPPCPTHFPPCPITQAPPCPTHFPPCPITQAPPCSLLIWVCQQPSAAGPCFSVHAICPTPSAVQHCGAESQFGCAAPSVQTICPPPSAVGGCPSTIACGGPGGAGGMGQ
jgi:hypothetical protein